MKVSEMICSICQTENYALRKHYLYLVSASCFPDVAHLIANLFQDIIRLVSIQLQKETGHSLH